MDLKTVIFDLDGTILNTIFDLKEAVNFALVELGYKERTLKEIREFIGNGLTKLMIRSLGKNEDENRHLFFKISRSPVWSLVL